MVSGVIPSPRYVPSDFIAHRVQHSPCASIFIECCFLITHALAFSASQFGRKKKSLRTFIRVCTRGDSNSRNRSIAGTKITCYTTGATGLHYIISLPFYVVSVCVSVTFVVFTDCESCTRPISTNPGSMEAGEYGLTRWRCFVTRSLEVVAVAGLLWISWCFGCFFFRFFFVERTQPAASMRPPCLSMRPPCLIYSPLRMGKIK